MPKSRKDEFSVNVTISSTVLIKCMPRFEYLTEIIRRKAFIPRWSLEDISFLSTKQPRDSLQMYFPMVCFCDIPIAQLKDHLEHYGSFAIGLTKEWGKLNGLNPILYISSEESAIIKFLREIIRKADPGTKYKNIRPEMGNELARILRYLKPYSGVQAGKSKIFYNEREWRYLPMDDKELFLIGKGGEGLASLTEVEQKKLDKYRLGFSITDIRYIILENEKYYDQFSVFLKGLGLQEAEILNLLRKVLLREEIKNDF
ncbi:MAG: abortive infection system antitoxin AbiGi family protein [Bacteroidetes bacterium]|nr:abortive infection system antitoxin AbiGi family protein [Bacteroidota bacterium]